MAVNLKVTLADENSLKWQDSAGIATGIETEDILLLWYLWNCKQTDIDDLHSSSRWG